MLFDALERSRSKAYKIMRAQQIIKEKKKKSRHLGGFPVVGIYFGNSTDSSDSGSEVEEIGRAHV